MDKQITWTSIASNLLAQLAGSHNTDFIKSRWTDPRETVQDYGEQVGRRFSHFGDDGTYAFLADG